MAPVRLVGIEPGALRPVVIKEVGARPHGAGRLAADVGDAAGRAG